MSQVESIFELEQSTRRSTELTNSYEVQTNQMPALGVAPLRINDLSV